MKKYLAIALIFGTAIIAQSAHAQPDPTTFALSSPEFTDGGVLNAAHSCDGAGTSPPLHWENVPEHTAGFAVTIDDPDAPAGNFTHWIVFDLPPTMRDLTTGATLPNSARSGMNSSGKTGFAPVCPPNGEHHYIIHIYALSALLDLPSGATVDRKALSAALEGHVLAESEITARYARKK